jgi:hypothetical protein
MKAIRLDGVTSWIQRANFEVWIFIMRWDFRSVELSTYRIVSIVPWRYREFHTRIILYLGKFFHSQKGILQWNSCWKYFIWGKKYIHYTIYQTRVPFICKSYKPRTRDISHILTRGAAGPEGKYTTFIPSSRFLTDLFTSWGGFRTWFHQFQRLLSIKIFRVLSTNLI